MEHGSSATGPSGDWYEARMRDMRNIFKELWDPSKFPYYGIPSLGPLNAPAAAGLSPEQLVSFPYLSRLARYLPGNPRFLTIFEQLGRFNQYKKLREDVYAFSFSGSDFKLAPGQLKFDCHKESDSDCLISLLRANKEHGDSNLRIVVVPELSIHTAELLGEVLDIDPDIFVDHLGKIHGSRRPSPSPKVRVILDSPLAPSLDVHSALVDFEIPSLETFPEAHIAKYYKFPKIRFKGSKKSVSGAIENLLQANFTSYVDNDRTLNPVNDSAFNAITIHWKSSREGIPTYIILLSTKTEEALLQPQLNCIRKSGLSGSSSDTCINLEQAQNQLCNCTPFQNVAQELASLVLRCSNQRLKPEEAALLWLAPLLSSMYYQRANIDSACLAFACDLEMDDFEERIAVHEALLRFLRDRALRACQGIENLQRRFDQLHDDFPTTSSTTVTDDTASGSSLFNTRRNCLRKLEDVLITNQRLVEDFDRKSQSVVSAQQRELTHVQIEESRQAMRQNDQVRKLTILAFVFIPLSTISSIFGMNVSEFMVNTPSLNEFGIVAGVITGFLLLVAATPYFLSLEAAMAYTKHDPLQYENGRDYLLREHHLKFWETVLYPLKVFKLFHSPTGKAWTDLKTFHEIGEQQREASKKRRRKQRLNEMSGTTGSY